MFLRWLTGLVVSSVALLMAWVGSYYWLGFVVFLLAVSAAEWANLAGTNSFLVPIAIVMASFLVLGKFTEYLPVILLIPMIPVIVHQDPDLIEDVVWTAAGMIWLSVPAVLLYELRVQFGLLLLIALLIGTWLQDSLALYSGKWFGGEDRMAPGLSPNKTWEGFLGGVTGITGTFVATGWYFSWPLWGGVFVGLSLGIIGQAGDLSVSALKRRIDLDDTGMFFPGHGGILDRVDSLIFNVAAYYPLCEFMEYLS